MLIEKRRTKKEESRPDGSKQEPNSMATCCQSPSESPKSPTSRKARQPSTLAGALKLLAVASILSQLTHSVQHARAIECSLDADCANKEKICHENKCICARDRPIEDQDRCLTLSLISEPCALTEQCLGNSLCLDGICSCGNEAISLFNPSAKIYYCHPKRRLNEECNYDSQCPTNSYCSTSNYGCLCINGFAQITVNSTDGLQSLECGAKYCTDSSNCESEDYTCDDNKCKCLATHFDPQRGKCYKFGSTGGKPQDDSNGNSSLSRVNDSNNIFSIVYDLIEKRDNIWLVIIVLIVSSISLFVLILMLIRRQYRGYCWTGHKKEYEPNNKNQSNNANQFNKNSINNKSFRQKRSELDDEHEEGDDETEDRSNLVTSNHDKTKFDCSSSASIMNKVDKQLNFVKVNINDQDDDSKHYLHQQTSPLASSTSTPV